MGELESLSAAFPPTRRHFEGQFLISPVPFLIHKNIEKRVDILTIPVFGSDFCVVCPWISVGCGRGLNDCGRKANLRNGSIFLAHPPPPTPPPPRQPPPPIGSNSLSSPRLALWLQSVRACAAGKPDGECRWGRCTLVYSQLMSLDIYLKLPFYLQRAGSRRGRAGRRWYSCMRAQSNVPLPAAAAARPQTKLLA